MISIELLRYVTLRSLRARPLRTLLSLLGIIIGVAGILSISITNQAAFQAITRLFENTSGRSDLAVIPASSGQSLRDSLVRSLAVYPGVEAAAPVLKAQAALADTANQDQITLNFMGATAGGLALYGIDPTLDPLVRQYEVTEGRFLSGDQSSAEVVLVETYAEDEDLRLGDRVELLTPNGVERLRVVGLIAKTGVGQTNNGAFGVAPLRTVQELFNRPGELDQVDLVLAERMAPTEMEAVRAGLENRLGSNYSVIYPASQGERLTQMLFNFQIGLNFLSGIALFIGAFLIYNAFTMTVVERTREFGMLRAIGMSRRQITLQVVAEAAILGLVGSILGVLMGILLARGLAALMGTILGAVLDVRLTIPAGALATSLTIGLGVTLLAAFLPAWQAGRISPITALRAQGNRQEGWLMHHGWKIGVGMLAAATAILVWNPFPYDVQFRLGSMTVFALFGGIALIIPAILDYWERLVRPAVEKIYGTSGSLGSRNIQRSRLRTTLTVGALLIGVAMILIVRIMTGSFSGDVRSWMNAYLGGDLYISSSVALRSDVAQRIGSVVGVAAVAPIRYVNVEIRLPDGSTETISFMGIDPVAHSQVTSFVFDESQQNPQAAIEQLAQGDAVFVSSVLAEKYDFQQGQTVVLKTRSGLKEFSVEGTVVDFNNQGLVVTGSWRDLRRYFGVNDANTFLVKVAEGQTPEEVRQRIDDLYGKRYRLVMATNESIRAQAFTLMDQAFSMFDVLAILAVLVGSLGVVNTLMMNVMERTREIGMLRATGMTRGQVVRMVLAEAGVMGLAGGILGLGFGVLLARIFLLGMTAMSGYRLDFQVPWQGILTGLVVALVISQLAAFLPARRAARSKILEAIHYE